MTEAMTDVTIGTPGMSLRRKGGIDSEHMYRSTMNQIVASILRR